MTIELDARIRAAAAACAERDHHAQVRAALAADRADAEREAEQLGAALEKQQRDVVR